MKNFKYKRQAAVAVMVLTIGLFALYFINHPSLWQQIKATPPDVFIIVLLLYFVTVLALAVVTVATLRLCKKDLPAEESILLTMYTAVVNFFGPLQSGPAFRGVYLKQKHGLSLKKYAVASSVYFFFFGGLSVLMLFSGVLKWWLIPIGILGLVGALVIERSKKYGERFSDLDMKPLYLLVIATAAQIAIISLIYFVELRSVATNISYSQVIIYTGAANLALFVSITPGAIGFRESFLLLSQRLHHISPSDIIAATTIDRAMYVVFLVLMAIYIFGTHAKKNFSIKKSD